MIKLLLLAALSLTSSTSVFAADAYNEGVNPFQFSFKDSSIKEEELVNPREGFKNLFESAATNASFAVKLNPLAVSFVEDYMDDNAKRLTRMKEWGKPYFDMIDGVLASHGLPTELKYLSVIESDLKTSAVSRVGAVGPWQFMPETARLMGLQVSRSRDDRRDFTKSTHAAARYLTELYGVFKDWLLVIAAYNGGPGNVNSAIRRSGSHNFWELQRFLPAESRMHVKKFIATHYIMEGGGGLTTLTKGETENYMMSQPAANTTAAAASSEAITVSGKYNAQIIAQFLEMNVGDFNRLNPGFDKQLAMGNSYQMHLPEDKTLVFLSKKPQILEGSIRLALTMAGR